MTRSALVVGGTGPTGPGVVNGLLERGFDVSVFHGGQHEVPLPTPVRHLHGDPHFAETIAGTLGDRCYDVVIAQYGRLRLLAEHFAGRTGHLVAISGANSPLAAPSDARWGALGRPAVVREEERHLRTEAGDNKLGYRIAEATRELLAGDFRATSIAYPTLYGPRQPGSPEWAIVRRLLDGRRRIIVPDGALKLESRAFVGNVVLAPLLAVDHPEVADGRTYVVTDRNLFTVGQRIAFLARHLGADVELVSLPYTLATPAHPYYRQGPDHRVATGDLIRAELGYEETVDEAEALRRTADWLRGAAEPELAEVAAQLGDPFDYAFEDELLSWWDSVVESAPRTGTYSWSHVYRHPDRRDERWRPSGQGAGR